MYTILIVDDKEIFRRKFKRIHYFNEHDDFVIAFEAQNGKEALEILEENKVDVVVTDIRMPVMDGMDLLKKIKGGSLCSCTILLSEYTDFNYAKEGLTFGAFDYVIKPVTEQNIEYLMNRIKLFLDNQANNRTFSTSETKKAKTLILEGDDAGIELFEKVIMCLEMNEKNSLISIQDNLVQMLRKIVEELFTKQKFMKFFVDMTKIDNIEKKMYSGLSCLRDETLTFLEMLVETIKKFKIITTSELILQVRTYILTNINQNISLKSTAEVFYVNRSYLSHLFKSESGMSFVDFLTLAKIERSKILLLSPTYKIYEVANFMGYEDTEYFSRIFQKHTGLKPTEYKNTRKKDLNP